MLDRIAEQPINRFDELLQRLDAAIASAYNEERFIDEINPPSAPPSKPDPKSRR